MTTKVKAIDLDLAPVRVVAQVAIGVSSSEVKETNIVSLLSPDQTVE